VEVTELAESIRLAVAVRCGSDNLIEGTLTLHTAVVGTDRSLLGSGRHGQATLYLFQKHILCWESEYIVCHNGIASVQINFFVLLEFPLIKN